MIDSLKNFKTKMYLLTLLYVSFCIAIIILYSNQKFSVEIFGTALLLLTTIYFSIRSYFLEYDKFFKELFINFNERYDKINNDLIQITNKTVLTEEQTKLVIDYFNMCSEQYMWEKRGRIPSKIYLSWLDGTMSHLKKEPINALFNQERKDNKGSYYGWIEYIEKRKR